MAGEPGGLMQFLLLIEIHFHIVLQCQGIPRDIFPIGLPVKILKAPSSILAT